MSASDGAAMVHPLELEAPPGVPVIETRREVAASPGRVFAAHRDADDVRRWLAPRGYEMHIERWDAVSLGSYEYVHVNPAGERFRFRGTFHTVRPELIIQTFEFEGVPDVVAIESLHLRPSAVGTLLLTRSVYPTLEARDGMLASGMADGLAEAYERLDELLAVEAGPAPDAAAASDVGPESSAQ